VHTDPDEDDLDGEYDPLADDPDDDPDDYET
jgi:hypothetical protein